MSLGINPVNLIALTTASRKILCESSAGVPALTNTFMGIDSVKSVFKKSNEVLFITCYLSVLN
jgi:hypothetical protein